MILEAASNTTPVIVSLTSVFATFLVLILVQIAGKLYRSADKVLLITATRMTMLDNDECKIRLSIDNTTPKVTHLKSMSLVYFENKRMHIYSSLESMPIQAERDFTFVYGGSKEDYMLRIYPHRNHHVVLDFKTPGLLSLDKQTQFYFYYINKRGSKRIAKINLTTDRAQVLKFKNYKVK